MTFRPHPMTHHDQITAMQYAEDVMRSEMQGGLTILPKHFHILAGLVRAEQEKRDEHDRAAQRLPSASGRVDGEDRAGGR
jgi:hypothetical protein